jgi:hypothetical protein
MNAAPIVTLRGRLVVRGRAHSKKGVLKPPQIESVPFEKAVDAYGRVK